MVVDVKLLCLLLTTLAGQSTQSSYIIIINIIEIFNTVKPKFHYADFCETCHGDVAEMDHVNHGEVLGFLTVATC